MEHDSAYYELRLQQELDRAGSAADDGMRHLRERWATLIRWRLNKLREEDIGAVH